MNPAAPRTDGGLGLSGTVFLITATVVLASPFFRGFWFQPEQGMAILWLLVAGFFWFILALRRGNLPRFDGRDWSFFALTIWTVLSFVWAVNKRAALDQGLLMMGYLSAYFVLSAWFTEGQRRNTWIGILLVWGTAVAFLGLLMYAGLLTYPGGMRMGRLYGLFQYANATASYLAATAVLAVGFTALRSSRTSRFIVANAGSMMFVAVFLTLSRGVFIALAIVLLALLVAGTRGVWIKTAGAILIPSILAATFSSLLLGEAGSLVLPLAFLAGVAAASAAVAAGETVPGVRRLAVMAAALSLLLLVALGGYGTLAVGNEVGDSPFLDRVAAISPQEISLKGRLVYYGDALRIWGDHLLVGVGAGSWESVFKGYQTYGYRVRVLHNDHLQRAVETGLVGMFLWTALLLGMGYAVVRQRQKPEILFVGAAAAIIIIHAFEDFVLSIPTGMLLLVSLLAWLRGSSPPADAPRGRPVLTRAVLAALSGLMILGMAVDLRLLAGHVNRTVAEVRLQEGRIPESLGRLRAAMKFDPWEAKYPLQAASLLSAQDPQEAEAFFRQSLVLDPANGLYHMNFGAFLSWRGRNGEAAAHLEKAVNLHPFQVRGYDLLANVYVALAEEAMERGDPVAVLRFAEKAGGVSALMNSRREGVPPWVPEDKSLPADTQTLALTRQEVESLIRTMEQMDPR